MLGFEITLFNIIGVCFLLCAALTFVIPVLVWAGNSICSLLWHFVDEGETAFRHRFTNTYLIQEPSEKAINGDYWYICKMHNGIKHFHIGRDYPFMGWSNRIILAQRYKSKEEAQEIVDRHSDVSFDAYVTPQPFLETNSLSENILIIPICGALGAGFILIPTITLVAGSAALSLYAMRWSRRAVKRSKKLDEMLSSHVQDPNAHKQASE